MATLEIPNEIFVEQPFVKNLIQQNELLSKENLRLMSENADLRQAINRVESALQHPPTPIEDSLMDIIQSMDTVTDISPQEKKKPLPCRVPFTSVWDLRASEADRRNLPGILKRMKGLHTEIHQWVDGYLEFLKGTLAFNEGVFSVDGHVVLVEEVTKTRFFIPRFIENPILPLKGCIVSVRTKNYTYEDVFVNQADSFGMTADRMPFLTEQILEIELKKLPRWSIPSIKDFEERVELYPEGLNQIPEEERKQFSYSFKPSKLSDLLFCIGRRVVVFNRHHCKVGEGFVSPAVASSVRRKDNNPHITFLEGGEWLTEGHKQSLSHPLRDGMYILLGECHVELNPESKDLEINNMDRLTEKQNIALLNLLGGIEATVTLGKGPVFGRIQKSSYGPCLMRDGKFPGNIPSDRIRSLSTEAQTSALRNFM